VSTRLFASALYIPLNDNLDECLSRSTIVVVASERRGSGWFVGKPEVIASSELQDYFRIARHPTTIVD
jgi:hypothetical protein